MSKICVVIPCYNEASRLDVKSFSDFISENADYDFLFVNDGSADDTLHVLEKLRSDRFENVQIVNLKTNSGKAEAVRQGVMHAAATKQYSFIAYFDADLATPLYELKSMRDIVSENPALLLVLCSRIKRLGANVERKVKRHILGRIFSTIASIILKLPVYDTQCGAKLIKADIAEDIFSDKFITSWLFDVEVIARIRNRHRETVYNLLYEYPVKQWKDVGGSKLKLKHMVKVPLELYRINKKYN